MCPGSTLFWCVVCCLIYKLKGALINPASEDMIDTSDEGSVYMVDGIPDIHSQDMMFRNRNEDDIEIDTDLSLEDIMEYNGSKSNGERRKRYILDVEGRRWTRGIIPYTFDDSLPQAYRENYLQEVFPRFEYWTHFRFVKWNSSVPTLFELDHQNHLIFVKTGSRCWSYLGNIRALKGQRISCCRESRCVHEIGHALGFYHEHSSPLRDDYVRINFENIIPGAEANFKKKEHPRARDYGIFDSDSFMTYGRKVHSKNGFEAITTLDDETTPIQNALGSSDFYMFKQVQEVYRMKETMCPMFSLHCDNDGYVSYVNGSCRCRCTPGMDPRTGCTTLLRKAENHCGELIHLDDENRDVSITSPSYPEDYIGNVNCIWFIKAPSGNQIKLEFTELEIYEANGHKCNGHVEIRSNLLGEPGLKYCGTGFKKSILSRSNTMSLFLTGSKLPSDQTDERNAKRFRASISLIKEEDICYTNQGKDDSYHGHVNFTRDFRSCIPWDRVTHCKHHMFSNSKVILEGNFCRNPGDGTQPWCYTDTDSCRRGYCDVCKLRRCYDLFADCQRLMNLESGYCQTDMEARRGCRQSCGWCNDDDKKPEPISHVTCQPPERHPPDAIIGAKLLTSYAVGDTFQYRCETNQTETRSVVCTSNGIWSYLGRVCKENSFCLDERRDCHILLQRNPHMCQFHRHFAETRCSRTCNLCSSKPGIQIQNACIEPLPIANVSLTSKGLYKQGDVVTYTCKKGYVLKRGSLNRACAGQAEFTGNDPVCMKVEESETETYHVSLRQRENVGKPNQLYLLTHELFRINRTGEIISWKFYNLKPGQVRFLVFRQLSKTKWFKLVGINDLTNSKAFRLNSFDVMSRERIAVQPGDYIGIYLPHNSPSGITYDSCKVAFNPEGHITWAPIRIPIRWQITRYYSMRRDNACKLVSVSAVIGPSSQRRYIYFG